MQKFINETVHKVLSHVLFHGTVKSQTNDKNYYY